MHYEMPDTVQKHPLLEERKEEEENDTPIFSDELKERVSNIANTTFVSGNGSEDTIKYKRSESD